MQKYYTKKCRDLYYCIKVIILSIFIIIIIITIVTIIIIIMMMIRALWSELQPVVLEELPLAWSWGYDDDDDNDDDDDDHHHHHTVHFQGEFPVQDIQSGEGGLLQVDKVDDDDDDQANDD